MKYEVFGALYTRVFSSTAESAHRYKEIKKERKKTGGRKKISALTDVKSSSRLVVGETEEPVHFHLSIDSTQWSSSG